MSRSGDSASSYARPNGSGLTADALLILSSLKLRAAWVAVRWADPLVQLGRGMLVGYGATIVVTGSALLYQLFGRSPSWRLR